MTQQYPSSTDTPTPLLRRTFDFLDRVLAVFLVSANLVFLMFAITAGAAQCAATASFVDDPDMLAHFTAAATMQCAVSPALRILILLFAGNALYISGIFASQTPVHRKWRWLPRMRRAPATPNRSAAATMNGPAHADLTQ